MAEAVSRLTTLDLRVAYYHGCFPMADENGHVQFYGVRKRALLPIEGIRVSRSLAKRIRRGGFEIRFDSVFRDVMEGCREREETWINDEIVELFCEAHREGWAHSCECWINGNLEGGVYGLRLGACFSAESMFHRAPDTSKLALWALVNRTRECGFRLFDAQILNPFLESLGAYEAENDEYLRELQAWLGWRPERFP